MGDIRIYNTRTRSVERFAPLDGNKVRIYVCGLTPSAQAHLGHARSFLFFDLLRRFLIHRRYDVTFVQNVTDIDDRSINRARETGEHWYDIVSGFYADFKASMHKLGVIEPDFEPYATTFIDEIQTMIRELIAKGYAYAVEDGIYYRVSRNPDYGKLSHRNIDELEAGARIEIGEHKEDPLDFALWKFAKPGEPKWPFEGYGDGRPGWHIECSAMSRKLLDPNGAGFDIHGGGADLIFPHHENEIAQSEPLMSRPPMANFWVHAGLLNFDGRKMSKSLGNFEPLSDLLARHDSQAIRIVFLTTGYSKVMNFTDESLAVAYQTLERLKKTYRNIATDNPVMPGENVGGLLGMVDAALENDMNTSVALAEVLNFTSNVSGYIAAGRNQANVFGEFIYVLRLLGIEPDESWLHEAEVTLPGDLLERLNTELGGELTFNGSTPIEAVERAIAYRGEKRAAKDWAASDRLRDALARCGIAVKDSKEGTTWTVLPTVSS